MLTLLAKHAAFDLVIEAAGRFARRSASHGRRHRHRARPGAAASPRRQSRHPPLRPFHAADGRDARHLGHRSERPLCHGVSSRVSRSPKIGEFDSELVEDFWQAVAANALMNLHVILHHGRNSHHVSEAVFKATARALRMAVEPDPRMPGVPSTKGTLSE